MLQEDFAEQPKYSIIRCLMDSNIEACEVWRLFEVYPHEVLLPAGVSAFVYSSSKGRKHIFINSYLSRLEKEQLLFHELGHVIEHLPKMGYVIGLDMQRQPVEEQADVFFNEVAAVYAGK